LAYRFALQGHQGSGIKGMKVVKGIERRALDDI